MKHQLAAAISAVLLASCAGIALAQDASSSDAGTKETLGTVTVTGSAVPRTDTETPSPVQVLTAAQISKSGLTTVADVVRSISADNSGSIPTAFAAGFAAGASGVALRGLTVNSTLVLVDGRRAADYAVADDGQRSFVDLNTIPLDAVERIEILKDGASSLYGADAIAGVVNVILRHEYQGMQAGGEVGTSQHGGGTYKRGTAIFGTGSLDKDHYNAYFDIEYQKDDRIGGSQRGFPFNTLDLSSIGGSNGIGGQPSQRSGSIYGSVTPGMPDGNGNIVPISNNPIYQPLRPCGPGTTAISDPDGSIYGGGAGNYCTQNFINQTDIQPEQERIGLFGKFTVKLNDYTEAYLSASYNQNEVTVDGYPSQIQQSRPNNTSNIALPIYLTNGALNPNNPFAAEGQYALINYAFGDIPAGADLKNHNFRVVGGVKGTFGDWNYDSALVINHTWLDTANYGYVNYEQLMHDVADGSYNFIDPSQNSTAVRAALAPALTKTSTSDLDSLDFRANRELFQLSGGAAGLALGGELRHEAQDDPSLNPGNAAQGLGNAISVGSRNVAGAYAELDMPVFKQLEVDVSGRYDHYSDVGGNFSPKLGLKWTPIEELALRGTYSKGFRAPSFSENGSSSSQGFVNFTPPDSFSEAHGGDGYAQRYQLAEFSLANKDIKPEKSDSLTLGAVFQPIQQLSASLDYYAIKKKDVITPADPSLALGAYFDGQPIPPGYEIIYDTPDPEHPDAPLRPVQVTSSYVNAASLKTEGIDFDLQARFELGADAHFVSDFNATKILSWAITNPDGSRNQYVGTEGPYNVSSGAGTPRYRASWANTLTVGPADVTATVYYTSGFHQYGADVAGPTDCLYTGSEGQDFPDGCRISSFTSVDLTGIYHLTPKVDVSAGVLNLFDRAPPLNPANYAATNYNPTWAQSGIVGRFYKVGVSVRF